MHRDLAFLDLLEEPILHDFLCAQLIAPVHQMHVTCDVGEVQRFFHSDISTANHGNFLAAIKEPVAGCTRRNAFALEMLFRWQSEIHRRRTCRDDQRITGVQIAVALQLERALPKSGCVNLVVNHQGVEALCMTAHSIHQVRTLQAFYVAGPVVDLGRCRELAADLNARDHGRFQIGPRSINGRRVASRT